jgi:hypothetical protein
MSDIKICKEDMDFIRVDIPVSQYINILKNENHGQLIKYSKNIPDNILIEAIKYAPNTFEYIDTPSAEVIKVYNEEIKNIKNINAHVTIISLIIIGICIILSLIIIIT